MVKKWLLYSLKPPTEISCKDDTFNPRAKIRIQEGKSRKDIAKAIGVSTSTINDRLTSKVWIQKLSGKDAAPLALKTIETLQPIKDLIHTITADNGKEFAKHQEIAEKLKISFYFANHTILGNVVPMRIRADSLGNTFQKERISVK